MEIKEFVSETVNELEHEQFIALKERLLGEYIEFQFIDEDKISKAIFSEKLCDYFEKLEYKTGVTFDKVFLNYVSDWDDIVKRYIPKEPSAKKGEPTPPTPRSRKYYLHAQDIKSSRSMTFRQRLDYSRIMMSLYMAVANGNDEVDDFDYDISSLDIDKIIASMKSEKNNGLVPHIGKKNLFDLEELYCKDTATFIITLIMFYFIKKNEIKGEY